MTPAERTLRARAGAHALHSRYDSREITRAARDAFFTRFVNEVDPDRALPEDERVRRAEHARRSNMARLSLKASVARRKAGGH